uniref:Rad21/Rec8-like protein N-terminal domain-containing protein n=1 Tax=Emiliania huxleyi TaxID=2903 RepID=A0A7S3RZI2_EMIHU
MFYSQLVLAKKGPLGKIWLAAHMEKKVPKLQIMATNIPESVDNIENPDCPMALRVSGHLLLGVVRIFSRKVTYLMSDCSEAIVKIKDAFRGPGAVELAPGASTRRYEDITNPEAFDEMDLDATLPSQQAFAQQEEDDLLAGMALPEGYGDVTDAADAGLGLGGDATLDGDGGLGGRAGFGEDGFGAGAGEAEEAGFGYNHDIAAFEAPLELHEPKRRRRSAGGEEEEDEMEVERMRSATDGVSPMGGALVGTSGGDGDLSQLAPEPEPALDFEPPRFDEEEDPLPGLGGAVVDDFDLARRSSVRSSQGPNARGSLAPADSARKSAARRNNKRKMLLDDELQIPTAQMKAQLADTSALLLDLDALPTGGGAMAADAAAAAPAADPFLAPPDLPYVPAALLSLPCFAPHQPAPSNKRRRSSAGAAAAAAAEEERPPPEEEPPPFDEPLPFDEPPQPDETFDEPPPPPSASRPFRPSPAGPPPPSFAVNMELPEVAANDVAAPAGGGSQEEGRTSEENWSLRTQKMYGVLAEAFDESGGVALSYNAMIDATSTAAKRKVVAGCLQELLFLATHGVTELAQNEPYGDIVIGKADGFDDVNIQIAAA